MPEIMNNSVLDYSTDRPGHEARSDDPSGNDDTAAEPPPRRPEEVPPADLPDSNTNMSRGPAASSGAQPNTGAIPRVRRDEPRLPMFPRPGASSYYDPRDANHRLAYHEEPPRDRSENIPPLEALLHASNDLKHFPPPPLPTYHGGDHEDPNRFLTGCEEYFATAHTPRDSRTKIASSGLREEAERW